MGGMLGVLRIPTVAVISRSSPDNVRLRIMLGLLGFWMEFSASSEDNEKPGNPPEFINGGCRSQPFLSLVAGRHYRTEPTRAFGRSIVSASANGSATGSCGSAHILIKWTDSTVFADLASGTIKPLHSP